MLSVFQSFICIGSSIKPQPTNVLMGQELQPDGPPAVWLSRVKRIKAGADIRAFVSGNAENFKLKSTFSRDANFCLSSGVSLGAIKPRASPSKQA
jgi:hypothetical protein